MALWREGLTRIKRIRRIYTDIAKAIERFALINVQARVDFGGYR